LGMGGLTGAGGESNSAGKHSRAEDGESEDEDDEGAGRKCIKCDKLFHDIFM